MTEELYKPAYGLHYAKPRQEWCFQVVSYWFVNFCLYFLELDLWPDSYLRSNSKSSLLMVDAITGLEESLFFSHSFAGFSCIILLWWTSRLPQLSISSYRQSFIWGNYVQLVGCHSRNLRKMNVSNMLHASCCSDSCMWVTLFEVR